MARQHRYGRPLTVAYLDLDNFQRINERLGQLGAGDLLRAIAETLRQSVRTSDIVARLGGDEFAMLLPETGAQQAAAFAERVRQAVRTRTAAANHTVTFSFGLVTFEQAPKEVDELLRTADVLMYEAKGSGKDGVRMTCVPTSSTSVAGKRAQAAKLL